MRLGLRCRALVAEDERVAVEGRRVGKVVASVGYSILEAPGIRLQELRVGIHLDGDGPRRGARVSHMQPEQRCARAVRREVGAGQLEARGGWQVHLGVAPTAAEAGRLPDPL